jgi:hypothetical protein
MTRTPYGDHRGDWKMDETNSRWFRWVARNAHYIFFVAWGVGAGAFGAVFFRAVDTGGDGLRLYMALLTVLMAGALGLVSSRAMDHRIDDRKIRRKINSARLSILRLVRNLELMQEARHKLNPNLKRDFRRTGQPLTSLEAAKLWAIAHKISQGASAPPDLDEVVETEEDFHHARRVADDYEAAAVLWSVPRYADLAEDEALIRAVEPFATSPDILPEIKAITALKAAERYFKARAGSL